MWLLSLLDEGVAWDPLYITQNFLVNTFGQNAMGDGVWNNLIWMLIGGALLGYAFAALATGQALPLLSKRRLKRYELPIVALIIGMTLLIQAGQPDLLSGVLGKFGINF